MYGPSFLFYSLRLLLALLDFLRLFVFFSRPILIFSVLVFPIRTDENSGSNRVRPISLAAYLSGFRSMTSFTIAPHTGILYYWWEQSSGSLEKTCWLISMLNSNYYNIVYDIAHSLIFHIREIVHLFH